MADKFGRKMLLILITRHLIWMCLAVTRFPEPCDSLGMSIVDTGSSRGKWLGCRVRRKSSAVKKQGRHRTRFTGNSSAPVRISAGRERVVGFVRTKVHSSWTLLSSRQLDFGIQKKYPTNQCRALINPYAVRLDEGTMTIDGPICCSLSFYACDDDKRVFSPSNLGRVMK